MNNELKTRFKEAVALKEVGDFDGARKVLLQLRLDDPTSLAVLAVLGHICWELKDLQEAISFFEAAIELKGTSEALSLGLFHCLWESGRIDEAFNEMKRFLASHESKEYKRLLADINNST